MLLTWLLATAWADEPAKVSWLEVVDHADPAFPEGPDVPAGQVRCDARVVVAADGVPGDVEVTGCPDRFAAAFRAVLPSWRWTASPDRLPVTAEPYVIFAPERLVSVEPGPRLPVLHGRATDRIVWPQLPVERHGPWDGPPVTCRGTLDVAPDGRVAAVDVPVGDGCAEAFAREARKALAGWRFAPLVGDGEVQRIGIPVQFDPTHETEPEARIPTAAAAPAIVLAHSEPPRLPDAVRVLGPGEVYACRAAVTLAPSGRPAEVAVSGCPEPLHEPVRDAVRRWAWMRTAPDAPKLAGFATTVEVKVRIP